MNGAHGSVLHGNRSGVKTPESIFGGEVFRELKLPLSFRSVLVGGAVGEKVEDGGGEQ